MACAKRWFFSTACSCATSTETSQRPACSETVAQSALPPGVPVVGMSPGSFSRARPSRGNWMASGKTTRDPVRRKLPKPFCLVLRFGCALPIAALAGEFALPLHLAPADEGGKGLVQGAQRLLGGTRAHLMQPRHNRLFERVP